MTSVSVLMPAYNRAQFVGEAIESVLAQRDVDLELIVIDDASTDATAEIAQQCAKNDPRFKLIRLHENRGASFALNAGLDAANGTYIARLDSDDVALPGRFAKQAAALDTEPDLSIVGTNYLTIDSTGRVTARVNRAESPEVLSYLMNFSNALGIGGTGMCRAATVRALGGFSREFRLAQGYELWARLARCGRVRVLPDYLVKYRVHTGSVTVALSAEQKPVIIELVRRTISAHLERTIAIADAEAVMARWWTSSRPGLSDAAHELISEVFEKFRSSDPPEAALKRARVITAGRFATSAIALARAGHRAEAWKCVRLASLWHPWGYPGLAGGVLKNIAQRRSTRSSTVTRSA